MKKILEFAVCGYLRGFIMVFDYMSVFGQGPTGVTGPTGPAESGTGEYITQHILK
jgi:hypothetical protein